VIGDPAPNCAKTYTASYKCADGSVNNVSIPAEGNGDPFVLYCGPGESYKGRFADEPNRDLSGPFELLDTPSDVPQKCVEFCRGQGQFFAGLQYGDQCFCGNTCDHYGPATNCNIPCSYDPGETCGGSWANSVYQVQ
jgi:WSC domain-containing protein